jgi:hypothetical protein
MARPIPPPVLDMEALTCSFERKLQRIHAFLRTRGASIEEGENRSRRRSEARA